MKDEIKEILEALRDSIDDIGTDKVNFINWVDKIEDYITNLQEENERLTQGVTLLTDKLIDMTRAKEDYKSRNEKAQDLILNELSHLKANDEETWNKEFYDENNKLDYRKLCIELLNQVINLLNGGDEEC